MRLGGWWRRQRFEREMEKEFAFHLDEQISDYVRQGMSRGDAERRARREFGALALARDECRDVRGGAVFDDALQDTRYAIRTLRRAPGFALVAIATLALGIGANTAIFSVVNAVLLRPLPYSDPASLVLLEPAPLGLTPGWALRAWRDRAQRVSDVAGTNGPRAATLVEGGRPEQIDSAEVTWNLFSFLGVPPVVGRDFTEADAQPGAPAVAVISHDLWKARFGADPAVLGRTITVSGESLTVVGVANPAFRFPMGGWLPASTLRVDTQPDVMRVANANGGLNAIGRLRPGSTPMSAGAELLSIFKEEAKDRFRPAFLERAQVGVAPLHERLVGNVRDRLWLVMGAVGFVLLVACANVANLLLARASTRARELAVRSALGARRGRLARLVLTESVILAFAGSAGALLIAVGSGNLVRTLFAEQMPHVADIAVDWWVLGFNIVVASATGILCGLASLPGVTRPDLPAILTVSGTPTVTGRTTLRRTLLAVEIAVTFLLVVGAALLTQTLWNLSAKERGFDADRLLTVRVMARPAKVDRAGYGTTQAYYSTFFTDLTQRVARLPGVESAAAVSSVPLAGVAMGLSTVAVDGRQVQETPETLGTGVASVTPAYFDTMKIRLVSGRDFNDGDRLGAEPVAIVNEAFRRRFAAGRDIVGSRLTWDQSALTVVGLVDDVPDRSFRDAAEPLIFTPLQQMAAGAFGFGQLTIVLRVREGDPLAIVPSVRREIWSLDANLVIDDLATMDERVAVAVRAERRGAWMFGLFALTALTIAAIGAYGIAAYAMSQRTKEIGIRVTLGAARRDVMRLIFSQTLSPTLAGLAAGLLGGLLLTRVVAAMLYGVTPLDPATFAGAATLVAAAALAAAYIPARRATQVDPIAALRTD